MYTQCPYCKTLFNVTASQLRSARGTVQCGHCSKTFDALSNLTDGHIPKIEQVGDRTILRNASKPQDETSSDDRAISRAFADTVVEAHGDKESEFARAIAELTTDPVQPSTVEHDEKFDEKSLTALDDYVPSVAPESNTPDLGEADTQAALQDLQAKHQQPESVFVGDLNDEESDSGQWSYGLRNTTAPDEIPQVLEEDIALLNAAKKNRRLRFVFSTMAFLLLLTLVLQYAWFMPDDIVNRYPMTRVWVEKLCAITDCSLAVLSDPSKVQIVSRDVRVHPRYEGALLITAVLVNEAVFVQEYPRMRFTVFNVNGQTIASRDFYPREYLASDIELDAGMRPKSPTQISLDIVAPEEAAVSFEFKFL